MSTINIAQIVNEARILAGRLKDDDKSTEDLICRAQGVHEKIACLKQYKDSLNDLHELRVAQRPRSVLVHNLQQENRQIKILQEENRQLKAALDEHRFTIDLIMKRYRQQVAELLKLNRFQTLAESAVDRVTNSNPRMHHRENVEHFVVLFEECLRNGEEAAKKDQQELNRLKCENQLLRRLLKIADQHDREQDASSPTPAQSQSQQ